MTTNTIIEALEEAAADLTAEVLDQEDAEVTPDLDAQLAAAEIELEAAERAEREAAGVADPTEHHRLSDAARWCRARVERLRAQRAERLAEEAEARRRAGVEEAERILSDPSLDDVAVSYVRAEDALTALIGACEARHDALVRAWQTLDRAGAAPGGGSSARAALDLPSGVTTTEDVVAGEVIGEMLMDLAERHKLVTSGGSAVTSPRARSIPRLSRGRVAVRAARLRETEVRAE